MKYFQTPHEIFKTYKEKIFLGLQFERYALQPALLVPIKPLKHKRAKTENPLPFFLFGSHKTNFDALY